MQLSVYIVIVMIYEFKYMYVRRKYYWRIYVKVRHIMLIFSYKVCFSLIFETRKGFLDIENMIGGVLCLFFEMCLWDLIDGNWFVMLNNRAVNYI